MKCFGHRPEDSIVQRGLANLCDTVLRDHSDRCNHLSSLFFKMHDAHEAPSSSERISDHRRRDRSGDHHRHFDSVPSAGRSPPSLHAAGVAPIDGHFLDFRDPWGNRIEIVGYDNIQFTKAPNVLRGKGLTHLTKNDSAKKELAKKGCLPRNDERTSGPGLGQSIPVKRHAR
jgi:hypothetical protein